MSHAQPRMRNRSHGYELLTSRVGSNILSRSRVQYHTRPSAMTSLADLINEIDESVSLVASRRAVCNNPEKIRALQRKLGSSMAAKIMNLDIVTPASAKVLLDAIKRSAYGDESCAIVIAAVDSKLDTELDEAPTSKASKKNQLLVNAPHWVTSKLVAALRGKSPFELKLDAVAEHLVNGLGCQHPHEQTLKFWLTLALLQHFDVYPSYQKVFDYLGVFKAAVKDCRKKTKIPPMATYPKNPHELPEPVFRLMFPEDDPPIAITIERFAATAKSHVPLRKNSKLLKLEARGEVPTTSVQQHAPRAPQQDAPQSATLPVSQTAPPDWMAHLITLLTTKHAAEAVAPPSSPSSHLPAFHGVPRSLSDSAHDGSPPSPAISQPSAGFQRLPQSLKPRLGLSMGAIGRVAAEE